MQILLSHTNRGPQVEGFREKGAEKDIWTYTRNYQGNGEDDIMRNFVICSRSINITGVITTRRVRWARNVARMEEKKNKNKILAVKLETT